MKRAGLMTVVLIAACATTGGSAWAGPAVKLCVPKAGERPTLTPKRSKCKRGYKLVSLGAEGKQGKPGAEGRPGPEGKTGPEGKAGTTGFTSGELETLRGILPCIRSIKVGIGGKPTVQFSGCNVQIVNGEGKTESTNGEGNLVIGYDEFPGAQTGSHNLVGGEVQTFTSYGGFVAGLGNEIRAPFASVSGGDSNTASARGSSVSGGEQNTANRFMSSISGGILNTASGDWSSVSGGAANAASGEISSVSGGQENKAKGNYSSIFGGHLLEATAAYEAKP